MGNCSSEHHAKIFRAENFTNDPTAFRVFVKKKNKFIPGWLKINNDEIVFTRGNGGTASANNFQFWPLAYLRRYGYTCSGIFFFESGRRCATGEGLHTFQSHQAEKIFHMVQGKIKIEEYARGSRASSVVSNNRTNVVNPAANSNRIHPVQRFSSEGSANEFRPTASPSLDSTYSSCPPSARPPGAPPPYEAYQRSLQEAMNRRLYATSSPASNCNFVMSSSVSDAGSGNPNVLYRRQRLPSTCSAYSANIHSTGNNVNVMVDAKNQRIERPRSVVSALEHGVCNLPGDQPFVPAPNSVEAQMQQHQRLADAGMFESYNAGHLLDRSFTSSVNGSQIFTASPWASQQQLEGEIVHEHVLSKNTRRYHQHQLQDKLMALNNQHPQLQQSSNCGSVMASASTNAMPTALVSPVASSPSFSNNGVLQRKYHSYVNVDLSHHGMSISYYGGGSSGNLSAKLLAAKELHRTNKSRQEFLSSQPGGFVFNSALSNFNPIMTSSMSGNSARNADLPQPNFQDNLGRIAHPYCGDGVQRSASQSAFTSLAIENGVCDGTRIRKRVPQLPLSPASTANSHQLFLQHEQNYAVLKTSPQGFVQPSNCIVPTMDICEKPGAADSTANQSCPQSLDGNARTNYAMIDFNKTKTLETVTNIKQGQSEVKPPMANLGSTEAQGAFV